MVSFYVNSFVHHDCSPDYFLFPFPFHLMHSFFFRKMQISSAVCWADSLKDVKEKIFAFDCSTFFKNLYWTFSANPCYHYQSLSDASRKSSYKTPQYQEVCDDQLPEEWYRFVGAAGTKMPTTRVPAFRCGTNWSGWLDGVHPTVEDGKVNRKVCFNDINSDCKAIKNISVINCGSYFIYKLFRPPDCFMRYCATDWM